jgi:DNA-binding transcriptional MerR regulator
MSDDTQSLQIVYSPEDICKMFGIKDSTLRKYAGLLSKHGYKFHSNEKGHRAYFDRDVAVIRRLIEIKESPDMTLEHAVHAVMAWVDTSDITVNVTEIDKLNKRHNKRYEELEKKLDEQNELIRALINRLEERESQRDQMLMQNMREIQETKQLLLASKEDEEKQEEKGFFARLFRK